MVMWELTTGCKPFADVEHNVGLIYQIIDGKRPEITKDTPECFSSLMKMCWDSNPLKRPTIYEIIKTVYDWPFIKWNVPNILNIEHEEYKNQFKQAEERRIELVQSKKLGPEFGKKSHPKAIFTSRELNSLISKSTSNSSSMFSFNIKQSMYYTHFFEN